MVSGIMLIGSLSAGASAQTSQRKHPDSRTFRSGDLLWPKRSNEIIPYNHEPGEELEASWRRERDNFVQSAEGELDQQSLREIQLMSLDDFEHLYFEGQANGTLQPYSGVAGTGHVAILEKNEAGNLWVIEAMMDRGVIRNPYDGWIRSRGQSGVWHGRVKSLSEDHIQRSVAVAKQQVGKPYNFWNFDLSDDTDFYCSKLVWYAFVRGAKLAIDGNPQPKRSIWLSPKQVLNSSLVDQLFSPGTY